MHVSLVLKVAAGSTARSMFASMLTANELQNLRLATAQLQVVLALVDLHATSCLLAPFLCCKADITTELLWASEQKLLHAEQSLF